MEPQAIYHFLFQTYQGVGVLFLAAMIVCLIACIIMERRTRKQFVDRPAQPDDWDYSEDEK